MHNIELVLIAIGLSFDTFAVSISTGLLVSKIRFWQGVRVALVLAFFQGFMPFLGWLVGAQVEHYIEHYDHWIAFILLCALGVKMIVESLKEPHLKKVNPLLFTVLLGMALATSIDALVVGVSLAFLDVNIFLAVLIIGFITFFTAMIGMLLGKNVNRRFGQRAEALGGLILILIGLRILLGHLFA